MALKSKTACDSKKASGFWVDSITDVTPSVQDECVQAAYVAIEKGDLSIVKDILTCKAFQRQHKKRLSHETANLLYCAASTKYLPETVKLLSSLLPSKRSALLNLLDEDGFCALHYAAIDGNVEAGSKLLQLGADSKQPSHEGNTALSLAIAYDQKDFSYFILPFSNVNTRDEDGDTPLMFAAWKKDYILLHEIIKAGADCNARSRHRSTALWNSVFQGSLECTLLLLINNADVDVACEGTYLFLSDENHSGEVGLKKIYPGRERSLLWVACDQFGSKELQNEALRTIMLLIETGYDVKKDYWIKSAMETLSFLEKFDSRLMEIPRGFKKNTALRDLLVYQYSRPQSLMDLSRNIVRKVHQQMHPKLSFINWVSNLGLGQNLRNYLTYQYLKVV